MRILFVIENSENLRTLASLFRELDERGHAIRLACKSIKSDDTREFMEGLLAESRQGELVSFPGAPSTRRDERVYRLRTAIDYLRYLEPPFADAPKLRRRAMKKAPRVVRAAACGPGAARVLRRTLQAVERRVEPPVRVERFLAEHAPDAVLVTPLVSFGSPDADIARAARRAGVPVGFPVRSWDNLTNKGLLRDAPDLVLVWNDLQKEEAVDLHGVPPERVRVAGAWSYDHWFDWEPRRTREELCAELGLDPGRPLVVYAGSSRFVAPKEARFFHGWVEALRERGGALAEAAIVARPHPLSVRGFRKLDVDDPQVSIWPREGQFPLGDDARQSYFDTIFHSAAVVGINTSAMIESAIVGRPVLTILADQFRPGQTGTLHFRYLIDPWFGHVRAARTLDEHAAQLERSVEEGDAEGLNERFVRRFVRPHGLDVPATPLAADAVEELGGHVPSRRMPAAAPS